MPCSSHNSTLLEMLTIPSSLKVMQSLTIDIFTLCVFVDPERSFEFPKEYLERVRTVHQDGGFGSEG